MCPSTLAAQMVRADAVGVDVKNKDEIMKYVFLGLLVAIFLGFLTIGLYLGWL
jgi:hypothetical protein